jgi:ParB family transcriptional regulator, chromosome partitioning protein
MQFNTSNFIRKPELVSVADIIVMPPRRQVDTTTVTALAESIAQVGLLNPITVREGDPTNFILITGLHRLEAFRQLERDSIPAFILPASTTGTEARMMEISENLHRAELTEMERADQIAKWIELAKEKLAAEKKVSVQVAPKPQGGRPEGGIRQAERELGIEHTEAVRAAKIASITPEAKKAARDAGIDDNQSKLLKVAAAPEAQQVATVHKLAAASTPTEIVNDGSAPVAAANSRARAVHAKKKPQGERRQVVTHDTASDLDQESATPEEPQGDGFIECCATARACASRHDLTNAIITPEMAVAAQKVAADWAACAQKLSAAVAQGITSTSVNSVCEADTRGQREESASSSKREHEG